MLLAGDALNATERPLVGLEMVGAQGEQQDDRDRDANQPQEDGTHALVSYRPRAG